MDFPILVAFWIFGYLLVGAACGLAIFPKLHLRLMGEYVERKYDYHMRLSKAPDVSEKSAANFRKEMRVCAREGEKWKSVLPGVPLFAWCIRWPFEFLVCAKLGFLVWDVGRRIRDWDARKPK